jgi:hypothetical protein
MTVIKSLAIEHPKLSQIIRVQAPGRSDALPLLRKS